jgi:hypothetical protein
LLLFSAAGPTLQQSWNRLFAPVRFQQGIAARPKQIGQAQGLNRGVHRQRLPNEARQKVKVKKSEPISGKRGLLSSPFCR